MRYAYIITITHFREKAPESKTIKRTHYAVASAAYQQALYDALAGFGKLDTTYGHKKYREAKEALLRGTPILQQIICDSVFLSFTKIAYKK